MCSALWDKIRLKGDARQEERMWYAYIGFGELLFLSVDKQKEQL